MKLKLYLGVAILLVIGFSASCFAGNLQLMSEKMAKQDLRRNIVESIIGYKVKSEGQFGLTQDANYAIKEKSAAVIKGVVEDRIIYDKNKDICICIGHIDLGDVKNILGERVRYKDVRVNAIGFGTMSPEYRGHLMALRAALVNAYDELANVIVGQKISSYTEVENFVLAKDSNKSKVCAAVYGAFIPNVDIDHPQRGWGWDDNGNAFVKLNLDLGRVKDILGQHIIYKGPNLIEVVGRGSQVDDLKSDAGAARNPSAPPSSESGSIQLPGYEPLPPK